jgi:indolepyruvate ferredoxin oxidoreductase
VLDPFGSTAERRTERKLIADYLAMIEQHVAALTPNATLADRLGAVA